MIPKPVIVSGDCLLDEKLRVFEDLVCLSDIKWKGGTNRDRLEPWMVGTCIVSGS